MEYFIEKFIYINKVKYKIGRISENNSYSYLINRRGDFSIYYNKNYDLSFSYLDSAYAAFRLIGGNPDELRKLTYAIVPLYLRRGYYVICYINKTNGIISSRTIGCYVKPVTHRSKLKFKTPREAIQYIKKYIKHPKIKMPREN